MHCIIVGDFAHEIRRDDGSISTGGHAYDYGSFCLCVLSLRPLHTCLCSCLPACLLPACLLPACLPAAFALCTCLDEPDG